MWASHSWAQMFSSTPPSHCLCHRSGTGHARKPHCTMCIHITHWPQVWCRRSGFSKEMSLMASGSIHVPCSTSSVKTPQPSDLPCTGDRKDKACLGFPHNIPAGESWEKGLKYVFLSWSCRISQGSSTAHQSGVDLVKYLPLSLGRLWIRK